MGLTPPLEGGSERHIYEISSRIPRSVVFTQESSICKDKLSIPLIKRPQYLRSFMFLAFSFLYSFFLILTPKKKYDLIHLHENLLYFITPILKLRYEVVITVHGVKGFKFYDNKKLWKKFKKGLRKADKIIAVNEVDKALLEKELENVYYVPNGVDFTYYNQVNPKIENKIVFIGRIHEQKGLIYLLEAFDILAKKYSKFTLEIVGSENEYSNKLKEKFPNKRIIWRGYIRDRKKIARTLKSAYLIVLPSLWEGLPLTLIESLASKRPVIVSDIPPFKSVINGEALLFKVKNTKDLVNKITNLLKDKKLSENTGKKGLALSKSYSWESIAEQTQDVYKK